MKLCIPTLCNYDGVDSLIRSAEAGSQKPTDYVVLDNGGGYAQARLDALLRELQDGPPAYGTVITPGKNLGVAASWNLFLERYGPDAPIVISNDDIVLGAGAFHTLSALAEHVPHAGYGWALFMQRPDCTERVGYYDENFWPGYYEDIDYIIRMKKAGIPEHRLEGKIDVHHAGWTAVNQLGDPEWLADGREKNRSYLIAKWGTDQYGTPYAEAFNGKPPTGWDLRKRLSALPLRWDLVNEIAAMIGARRYLELGLADGSCIRRIKVPERVGVDIAPPPHAPGAELFTMPTDEFFRKYTGERFDLVFVDADHAWEQAYRDVENAIRWLNPGGVVVMHDCSPFSKDMQIVPHNGHYLWTGDVWKAVVRLRWEGQHATRVVDSNYGLGIVIPGGAVDHLPRRPRKPESVTYEELVADRDGLLGLLSGWEWWEWFGEAYAPLARRPFSQQSHSRRLALNEVLSPDELWDRAGYRAPSLKAMAREVQSVNGLPAGVGEYYAGVEMTMPGASPGVGEYGGDVQGVGIVPAAPPVEYFAKTRVSFVDPKGVARIEQSDTRIGDGEETFADIIAEKARRKVADADEQRDTLVVVFSKLPRADTTGTHLLTAFERQGVPVVHYDPLDRSGNEGTFHPRGYAGLDLDRVKAVLCIDDDHGWPVPETPGIRRYYWCIDTYRMDAELYLGGTRRGRLRYFDKNFFVQKKEAEEFGGIWLPVGVDLQLCRHEPREKLYDFCFIGNHNHERAAFIERLRQEFPRSFVGNAYGEEANTIYNQSHIAINRSAGGDINMRMFEAQATSAFCLSNRIDNGEADFLPYLWLYESYEECVAMMRTLLKHPATCATLAEAQAQAMVSHSYEERAWEFLNAIGWVRRLDMSRFPNWSEPR